MANNTMYKPMKEVRAQVLANVTIPMTNIIMVNSFKYSYISKHIHQNKNREITMYHLMFDLSDIVIR